MQAEEQRWIALGMEAGRVFTPASPIDEPSLFAGRLEQVRQVVDAVNQKGQHAILYGERGVGKTSLANVLSAFLPRPGSTVLAPRVNCDGQDTFATVWEKVFERVADEARLSRAVTPVGFASRPASQPIRLDDLVGGTPSPDRVRRALSFLAGVSTPVLIIDEFDRLPQPERRAFADTVKMLSDHAVGATLVLVGVADSVEQLIEEHQSVERALVQIRLPRMSAGEIGTILETGLGQLGMTADSGAVVRIARLSQGLPHYAHLLGLHASRAAIDARTTRVTLDAVEAAIGRAIAGAQQSIRSGYELAVRSARRDHLFADVLLACALAETSELGRFSALQVREQLQQITGRRYEIPSFAKHLNEFCDPKRGPVLERSGPRRLYRYRFRNPLMQPFVIMQGLKSGRIEGALLDSVAMPRR